MTTAKKERIASLFPGMERIKNETLKEKVMDVWIDAWEKSSWDDLEECPFNPAFPDLSLVGHINCLADILPLVSDRVKAHYPETRFDADLILAGIYLHDVSKVLEIEKGPDNQPVFSKMTKTMPHALYGAFLALTQDLPDDLVNLILSHTRHTGTRPATQEAVLLHYIDYMLADLLRFGRSLDLIMDGKVGYGR